ncbi:MAG: RnfABCDGE type electron transport complex subunit D [Bacteroidia bacterium]
MSTLAQNPLSRFIRDARHFQIVYLSLFLIYGIAFLGWGGQFEPGKGIANLFNKDLLKYVAIIGTTVGVQALIEWRGRKDWRSLKSALITSLGLCLLCKGNTIWTLSLAAFLAVSGKYLIRFKNKHIFNPGNFGIVMAIVVTGLIHLLTKGSFVPDAWVSPGQWGDDMIYLFVLGALGAIVLLKVGRIWTSLAFLGSFGVLVFARDILYQGWPMDHFFHTMTNGSLLLFTFFMITDPVTTPNAKTENHLGNHDWRNQFFSCKSFKVHAAPIYTLFIAAPLQPFSTGSSLRSALTGFLTQNQPKPEQKSKNKGTNLVPGLCAFASETLSLRL